MQENEVTGDTGQISSEPQQPAQPSQQTEPLQPPTSPTPQEPATEPLKKNNKLYLAAGVILVVLIAVVAIALNSNTPLKNITVNQTTASPPLTSVSTQAATQQNSSVLLSGIPLAPNMLDYYTYSSNMTEMDQYGLPFTKDMISATTLPSNYTLQIPLAYSNVSSPIMVFISTTTYPNRSQAKSDYVSLLKNISEISTSQTTGPVNNSIIYHANMYGLSLIGSAITYGNTISVMLTWGVNTFNNSSYVSNMALKQYSIISNKTK